MKHDIFESLKNTEQFIYHLYLFNPFEQWLDVFEPFNNLDERCVNMLCTVYFFVGIVGKYCYNSRQCRIVLGTFGIQVLSSFIMTLGTKERL